MSRRWIERLRLAREKSGSSVCCGIDLDAAHLPSEISLRGSKSERVLEFTREVVTITSPHVCCYKIQKAYLEVDEGATLSAVTCVHQASQC